MIPLHLSLCGFLSYQGPVEIDFTNFDLACISGANGAGKSSLLDAITWALFGQARKRDDSLINNQSDFAEVSLIFQYEGNTYRVLRSKEREKTTLLEFQILQDQSLEMSSGDLATSLADLPFDSWKPLTERSLRETETRIRDTLRLDYETFVNASFFLQGKADLFTQQRPGDRKRILSTILGLEIWETYRQRAADLRRGVEREISSLDGRLSDIAAELGEEQERKERLKQLERDLKRISQEREAQQSTLANLRQIVATINEQRKFVDTLNHQLEASQEQLDGLVKRLEARQVEKDQYTEVMGRAEAIETAHQAWLTAKEELERWEGIANQFREQEAQRNAPLAEIQAEQARLEQELKSLQEQQAGMLSLQHEIESLQPQIESTETTKTIAEAKLDRRDRLQTDVQESKLALAEIEKENKFLQQEMNDLKARIDKLRTTEEAICPTCGRMLNTPERLGLIDQLNEEGAVLGDRYRDNQAIIKETKQKEADIHQQLKELGNVDAELRALEQKLTQLTSRLEHFQSQLRAWEANGAPRLERTIRTLAEEAYAQESRRQLAEIEAELKAIGYDAAAHDQARKNEADLRSSEDEIRTLEKARATLAPLEREIIDIQKQISTGNENIIGQREIHQQAVESLTKAKQGVPDLQAVENDLRRIQEQENRLRLEVGAADQKVLILDDLKDRRTELEEQREQLAQLVSQYKQLERAFSKDGVPALLIEQALPQIEAKTNEILDRLSEGAMSVQFITQAKFKDKRRDDLRETLDIQISDGSGKRDYEMYSGGEAFRVNFAIRLALSEVLAQRAGARLQTLVIDEGFGSQDAQGRQRLIEAINLVKADFAKILVITHIDELKDAFPTRIEVEKNERGSFVKVN